MCRPGETMAGRRPAIVFANKEEADKYSGVTQIVSSCIAPELSAGLL